MSSRKNTLYKVRRYRDHVQQFHKTHDSRMHKVVTRQNIINVIRLSLAGIYRP
jgi:hypothetical protein